MLEKHYIDEDQPVDEEELYCCADCGSLQTAKMKRVLENCIQCGSEHHGQPDDYSG